jgi:hypothetical protein
MKGMMAKPVKIKSKSTHALSKKTEFTAILKDNSIIAKKTN